MVELLESLDFGSVCGMDKSFYFLLHGTGFNIIGVTVIVLEYKLYKSFKTSGLG